MPMKNIGLISSAAPYRRLIAPGPEMQCRKHGGTRFDERLAEIEREPGAEQEQGNADGDVVDLREAAYTCMQQSQHGTHETRDQHAKPWRSGETRRGKPAHGTHQQGAFEAYIDPTAFFGQHFAETDK